MLGAGTAPSTGLYIASNKDAFTINGTIVKKLDNQFINSPIMIVDVAGEESNLTSSASLDEIVNAVKDGKIVFARMSDNLIMNFSGLTGSYEFDFKKLYVSSGILYLKTLIISEDKTCTLYTQRFSLTEAT